MNSKNIDIINIFLIIISLVVAIIIPFELFLFSYAILGPLHYLTEINWLREKNYFISDNKNGVLAFVILIILVAIYDEIVEYDKIPTSVLILIAFLFPISLFFLKKIKDLAIAFIFMVSVSFILYTFSSSLFLFIGLFLPTLVHVYVFTLFFILYGALKSKSSYGFYLGILLFIVPCILSYIPIDYTNYEPSKDVTENFVTTNMDIVGFYIVDILFGLEDLNFNVFAEVNFRIQIFISFAYTYHYLNWFSKTSLIGWGKAISKKRVFLILFIWIVSIGLYIYDFNTGYIALSFLSFLHVLLEFPLNIVTIKELFLLTKIKRYTPNE